MSCDSLGIWSRNHSQPTPMNIRSSGTSGCWQSPHQGHDVHYFYGLLGKTIAANHPMFGPWLPWWSLARWRIWLHPFQPRRWRWLAAFQSQYVFFFRFVCLWDLWLAHVLPLHTAVSAIALKGCDVAFLCVFRVHRDIQVIWSTDSGLKPSDDQSEVNTWFGTRTVCSQCAAFKSIQQLIRLTRRLVVPH